VLARLKGHIGGRAARLITSCIKGIHFGMCLAGVLVKAFTYDPAIANQYTANARIRCGGVQPTSRKPHGVGHVAVIGNGENSLVHSESGWLVDCAGN
jgi:hypothetical protein